MFYDLQIVKRWSCWSCDVHRQAGCISSQEQDFQDFNRTAQVEETPEVLLALAAANRLLDAPQWQLVEDKCCLHELLKAGLNRV